MSGYIPESWFVLPVCGANGEDHNTADRHKVSVYAKGRVLIADCHGSSCEEASGRARAIAILPELLKALKDLVEDVEHEDHEPGDWSVRVAVRNAQLVILKARGETDAG